MNHLPNPDHITIMATARERLEGNWGMAILAIIVMGLLTSAAGLIPLGGLIVSGPLTLGLTTYFIRIHRRERAEISQLFDGFNNFLSAFLVYLLMVLVVLAGMILLVVPGIIAALGLSQVFFILANNPDEKPVEVLKRSWALMDGRKWDYFLLGLRFLVYIIAGVLPLAIGAALESVVLMVLGGLVVMVLAFWLSPYIYATYAAYYDSITDDDEGHDLVDHLVEDLV